MTATVPGWIAWPLIAFMAIVIAVRYKWFNKNQYETYFNNTLALMLAAQLLRERAVEELLSRMALMTITTAQQLSLILVFFMAAEFMGFISLWSKLSFEETRRRHTYHRLAALVLSTAFLIVTTRARVDGQVLEVSGGWDGVLAWGLYAVLPVTLAVQIFNMAAAEIRRPDARRRERLVMAFTIAIAVAIGMTTLIAMSLELFEELGWAHTLDYRLHTHAFIFFWEAVGTAAVATVPCAMAVMAHLGLDPISRRWRQLQGLRSDMNAAVPESVFALKNDKPSRRKTPLQLHQTTVEIRDAILQLRPYFRDAQPGSLARYLQSHNVPVTQHEDAIHALRLAEAVRTKAHGGDPTPPDAAFVVKSRSTTLGQETAELLRLSRWWPVARATAVLIPDTAKANSTS